jgi:hypothetical protein
MEWVALVGRYDLPVDVKHNDLVEYRLRDGYTHTIAAGQLEWDASQEDSDTDIVAYRKVS